MADYTLSAKLTGDSSQFTKEFEKAQGKLDEFNQKVGEQGLGKTLMGAGKNIATTGAKITGATAPLLIFASEAFKTGTEYEASMSKVQAITQATGGDFEDLQSTARELGSTTRYSASEAADAMGFLGQSGMDTEQIMAAIPDTLDFATAAGLELARASEIVAGNINAFGLEAGDAARVSDVFAKAQVESAMDAEQLASAMEKVAPMAASMGHEIEGTSALLAILANNEIKGARAGTMLNRVYKDITDSAEDGKIAIGEHSVEVFDANGNMRDMTSIVADVADATKGMTDEQKMAALSATFQGQSMDALIPLLNSGSDALLDMEASLYDAEGAAGDMADTMDDNMAGSMASLGSSMDELKIRFFEVSEGPIRSMIDGITGLVDKFSSLDDGTLSTIAAIAGVAIVIGPLIMLLGGVVAAIGALISPVGLGVAAFAALSAAGVLLYKGWQIVKEKAAELGAFLGETWEKIKESISTFLEPIGEWFSQAWTGIVETTSNIWSGITDVLSNVWSGITDVFNFGVELVKAVVESGFTLIVTLIRVPLEIAKALVQTVWNYIGDSTTKAWNKISSSVGKVTSKIQDTITKVFNKIKDITSSVWDSVSSFISTTWDSISSKVSAATGAIRTVISGIWNTIRDTTSSVWNTIKTAVTTPINAARDTVSTTVSNLSSTMSNVFGNIRSTASNIFNSVKEAMSRPINAARDTISSALDSISGFFSRLRLRFPKIQMPKLPKFSLTGSFSLKPPSVPRLGVSWHAKGAIFTRPTVFGSGHGVGEAGAEAVLPIEKLGGIMADTMTRMGYSNSRPEQVASNQYINVSLEDANIYDTRDIKEISKDLANEISKEVRFG